MPVSFSDLARAARLARAGKLGQASRLVQRALGLAPRLSPRQRPSRTARAKAPGPSPKGAARLGAQAAAPEVGRFTRHFFRYGGERHAYHLFVPEPSAGTAAGPRPLIVLLHGCRQDAADFAQGTGMNRLAQQHQCLVLYPEQLAKSNPLRCWNWFERAHQRHDTGEPGMIAALTREVLKARGGDPARVYIAGLSAGGAMAVLVARLYPGLFAAAGVHSGLAAGAAGDVMSALRAMREGASAGGAAPAGPGVPTIVFHGSGDKTVHPANGEQVVLAALAGLDAAGVDLVKSGGLHEGRPAKLPPRRTQRTRYSAADGVSHVEHWAVDAGPHAWSGGDPAGSFTDPQGPGASAAMLAFFLQHRNAAAGAPAAG